MHKKVMKICIILNAYSRILKIRSRPLASPENQGGGHLTMGFHVFEVEQDKCKMKITQGQTKNNGDRKSQEYTITERN